MKVIELWTRIRRGGFIEVIHVELWPRMRRGGSIRVISRASEEEEADPLNRAVALKKMRRIN